MEFFASITRVNQTVNSSVLFRKDYPKWIDLGSRKMLEITTDKNEWVSGDG
jgi:hypothetical protein